MSFGLFTTKCRGGLDWYEHANHVFRSTFLDECVGDYALI
jgi:hypothetical protein